MKDIQYHILNGDTLKERFPAELGGEIIVLRECMVEGNVNGGTPTEIFDSRKLFFKKAYLIPADGYHKTSQLEIEKILNIPDKSEITLWFEDDLFCQANLWFSLYLLTQNNHNYQAFLVRPNTSLQEGFSGLDQKGLMDAFHERIELNQEDQQMFKELWKLYQQRQITELQKIAERYLKRFPFLHPAIDAVAQLYPPLGLREPHTIVKHLIKKHGASDFGKIFRAFIQKVPIYGFGDMQVKRIFDELKNDKT